MGPIEIIFGILLLVMSVFLIIAVLMQSGKDKRLSGSIAGGAETFFGKGKARSLDAKLQKITKILAIVIAVIAIAMTIIN